jgi:hypothetical protein
MSKRMYALGRHASYAQARSSSRAVVHPDTPRHHPPRRHRTPRRPKLRRRSRNVAISQTRRELVFLLLILMFTLVLLSPLLAGALIAFDKLLPFLTLIIGHYFGQK